MKWLCLFGILAMLLSGCSVADTFETVADDPSELTFAQQKKVVAAIPEDTYAMQSTSGTLYFCDGYEFSLEVLSGGDLNATVETLSGFSVSDLTVMETAAADAVRFEFVWTSVGDEGERVNRAVIMDDGAYHYCLSLSTEADNISMCQETWQNIIESFSISPTE